MLGSIPLARPAGTVWRGTARKGETVGRHSRHGTARWLGTVGRHRTPRLAGRYLVGRDTVWNGRVGLARLGMAILR